MNLKLELIALAVRYLGERTTLIRQPDSWDLIFWSFLGGESYDRQLAREIDSEATRVIGAVKQGLIDRKFRQLTKNF